jgi:hypothetical protein
MSVGESGMVGMLDEAGSLVLCRITPEALRELLEQVASDVFDASEADEAGCILATKEALN